MRDDYLTGDVHLAIYGPGRFPAHEQFAPNGYLFTVPGNYPEDTPSFTNVTDQEMAVYRTKDDPDEWEVRDANGNRRAVSIAGTRRQAIASAFAVIARQRRRAAARVIDNRRLAGLEPCPPYVVEVTNSVTLVIAPPALAILDHITPAEGDEPARYRVRDTEGGEPYEIRQTPGVMLSTTTIGVLHERCDHDPDGARFESESQALVYAKHSLAACWPCTDLPGDRVDGH
ncbi:hypothetical protein ACFYSF_22485 [Streptomyces canus]|uniref:hypothetical protein n=1 Tax=Streptomyces canus TaxID=58343 RepID=UPI0036B22B83